MRRWIVAMACIAVSLLLAPIGARAHFGGAVPYYPGATPRALCYVIDEDMGDLWQAWIENATANWNQANTGWSFKPCKTDDEKAHPDIRFRFNPGPNKISGGAQGGPRGGGTAGFWEIIIEPDLTDVPINGRATKGGVNGKGWRMKDEAGETTLDPVMVLGHELGHALGLDHNPGCDTGNLEDPICPGNHNNPVGRKPSQSDVDEVKKGVADQQRKEEEAKRAGASHEPSGGGSGVKHNALETGVLDEINFVRTHPQAYAQRLGTGPKTPAALDAIAFLQALAPMAPLADDAKLDASAAGFAADQGPRGGTGHIGSDGSSEADRMKRAGALSMADAETISLGQTSGAGVVRQFVIDEGVPSRAHRTTLLDPAFKFVGVGCGPHAKFGEMCVVDFTGAQMAASAPAYDCAGAFYDASGHVAAPPPSPHSRSSDAALKAWIASVQSFYLSAYSQPSGSRLDSAKAALCTDWRIKREIRGDETIAQGLEALVKSGGLDAAGPP